MPYAVSEIRALAAAGHTVHAADTFPAAPGSHSNAVTFAHETLSPRRDPVGYVNQIHALVDQFAIDLVVPTFEEVFYLTAHGREAGDIRSEIFAPPFSTLSRLHNKAEFLELGKQLGLPVPETCVCRSADDLRHAIKQFERYFGRAVYSRAGVGIVTNHGPLANETPVEAIEPSPEHPWIVQGFMEGVDMCSFSIARDGRVLAHSTYEHPKTLDDAGGIVFETVDSAGTLRSTQTIVEALGYHGQVSFDFMRTADGTLYLVECNPRPTSGVSVMDHDVVARALLGELMPSEPQLCPAGRRAFMRSALLRDMVVNPGEAVEDLRMIFSDTPDVYFDPDDRGPGYYQFLSLAHVVDHWREEGSPAHKLADSYLHDVCWNGEPIPTPRGLVDRTQLTADHHDSRARVRAASR